MGDAADQPWVPTAKVAERLVKIINDLPMLVARNLAHLENSPRQLVEISRFFLGLAEFFERDRGRDRPGRCEV